MVFEHLPGEFGGSPGVEIKIERNSNLVPDYNGIVHNGYFPDTATLSIKRAKNDNSSTDSDSSSSGKGSMGSSMSLESVNIICDEYGVAHITHGVDETIGNAHSREKMFVGESDVTANNQMSTVITHGADEANKNVDVEEKVFGEFDVTANNQISPTDVCLDNDDMKFEDEDDETLNNEYMNFEDELEDENEGNTAETSSGNKCHHTNLNILPGKIGEGSLCGEKDANEGTDDNDLGNDCFDDIGDENENDDDDEDDDDDDLDVRSFLARMDAEIDNDNLADDNNGYYNPAIDRGYAWIIVLAVFFIHFLFIGYHRSGGVFFVEFQRQFHSSASMTSLVIGLTEGVYSISALTVLGFLVKFVSVRQLCLVGSLVLVLGIIGNSMFDRIEYLILTHSLGSGLAGGLLNGPSIVIINEYFHKRRALATSLATTGASCGGVIFPFVARLLFDNYSFQGGLILTAGMIMHIFFFSMLLIPVKNHAKKTEPDNIETNGQVTRQLNSKVRSRSSILDTLKQRWTSNGDQISMSYSYSMEIDADTKSNSSRNHIVHPSQNIQHNKLIGSGVRTLPLEQFSSKLEICEEGVPLEIQPEYHAERILIETPGDLTEKNFLTDATSLTSQYSHANGSICSSSHQDGSRYRLDVIYSNPNELEVPSAHTSNLFLMSRLSSSKQTLSRSILFKSTSTLNNTIADLISTDQDYKRTINIQPGDKNNVTGFRKLYASLCETPILRSASFWMLFPFYFTATVGVALPQMYLVPLAKERGLTDDQASFCLSLLNIMDIVSHILPGVIVNCGLMKSTSVCIVPILVVGLMGQLTPFFTSYATILSMSVVYGLCGGFYFAMQSVIVVDTVGIDNFTSCIGIYYVVIGLAGAISYPVAGAIKDLAGTYSTTYHYLASHAFFAVIVLIALPLARRYDVRRGVLKP